MNNHPLVSIIMNCYNSDRFLRESIESVYAQTYGNWEIIFWDNNSTDTSGSIALSYDDKVKYYCADNTTPLGEARNLALSKATGKYIAFLDCDDVYLPIKLEQQVKLMDINNYIMTYGSAIFINEDGGKIRDWEVKNKSGMIFGDLLEHYEINMQTVMILHKHLQQNKLLFNENLKYCPDYNLFMRIASEFPIGVINDTLVKYRLVGDSLSKQTVDIAASEIRITLDHIFDQTPALLSQYKNNAKTAYAKLHYYDAIAALYRKDNTTARKELHAVLFSRWEYFALYVLIVLHIPRSLILRLLGRH